MGRRIEVKAPSRIDLAGGWTDVPTYCNHQSGEVVNIAINQYVRSEMIIDDERKLSLSYSTDMPTGSGLGTSGAMNVGLITTIMADIQNSIDAAEIAYQFEALLGNKGGRQDQWASALGGINHLTFIKDEVKVTKLNPSKDFCDWLESHILLFNSHITHVSGDLHKSIWRRYEQSDNEILNALNTIREAGILMAKSINEESIEDFVAAMRLNSEGVDQLGAKFHDPFRENIANLCNDGIISAWKAMGAGGGGVVGIILAKKSYSDQVISHFQDIGWSNIPWKIDYNGVKRTEINL